MEMMIVVAIIAVLIAIIIPTFKGALERANAAADEANLRAYYAEVMAKAILEDKDPVRLMMEIRSLSAGWSIPCMARYV